MHILLILLLLLLAHPTSPHGIVVNYTLGSLCAGPPYAGIATMPSGCAAANGSGSVSIVCASATRASMSFFAGAGCTGASESVPLDPTPPCSVSPVVGNSAAAACELGRYSPPPGSAVQSWIMPGGACPPSGVEGPWLTRTWRADGSCVLNYRDTGDPSWLRMSCNASGVWRREWAQQGCVGAPMAEALLPLGCAPAAAPFEGGQSLVECA